MINRLIVVIDQTLVMIWISRECTSPLCWEIFDLFTAFWFFQRVFCSPLEVYAVPTRIFRVFLFTDHFFLFHLQISVILCLKCLSSWLALMKCVKSVSDLGQNWHFLSLLRCFVDFAVLCKLLVLTILFWACAKGFLSAYRRIWNFGPLPSKWK